MQSNVRSYPAFSFSPYSRQRQQFSNNAQAVTLSWAYGPLHYAAGIVSPSSWSVGTPLPARKPAPQSRAAVGEDDGVYVSDHAWRRDYAPEDEEFTAPSEASRPALQLLVTASEDDEVYEADHAWRRDYAPEDEWIAASAIVQPVQTGAAPEQIRSPADTGRMSQAERREARALWAQRRAESRGCSAYEDRPWESGMGYRARHASDRLVLC